VKEVDPDTEYADGTGLGGAVWVREAKVCVISFISSTNRSLTLRDSRRMLRATGRTMVMVPEGR